ncbi:MAG: putative ATPase, partial [Candidatus Marinamargulisbacteria bacterium]
MTPEKYPYSTVSKQIEAALHIARALGHFQSQKLRVEAVSFAELVFSEDGVLTDGFTTGSEIRDVTAIENHHLTVLSGVFGDLFLESGSVYSEPQNLVITQMLRKLASQADAVKYQTLNGVIADLEVCKSYLAEGRPLDYFQLGQKDFTQSLTLGKYVYGREHELGRICRFLKVERPGVVMLSGDAGIGKSTLLDLISDKLGTESWVFRGRFFQGGQAPYQIFGNIFCQFVLEKRRVEPEFWILSRRKAISVHSWVLEELIPELSCIMGPSDRGSGVGVSQTQYHVRSAILWFFELILTEAKPVVLILDDVQWADRNSLEMVEFLNSQIKEGSFSTVLSFRQSDFSSPFVRDDLAAESWHRFRLLKVKLSGLMASDFQEMLADLVKCEPHGVTELADILSQKTGGNPFEVNQMIRKCLSRKLIRFDSEARRWRWQMKDIKWLTVAANMGRLLSSQIEGQSPTAIQILQIASCFGGEVEGALLAVACEYDEDNMGLHLWAAIDQGILIFSRKASSKLGVYKFSHDRIRGSIYNSLGRLKGEIHLRIGRRLGSSFDAEDGTINRFVLAQQYLKAIPAIQSDTERRDIACLLYVASLDAKRQAGFELALALVSGAAVLLRGAGSDSGSLSFEILKEEADLSFVSGSLKKGEALVRELSTHYPCSLKQAALTNLLVESYIGFGHSAKAIEIGLSFLGKTALSLKQEKISVGFFVRLFLIEVWLRARMWRGRQEKTVACPETAALYDLSINVLTAAWMLGKVDLFGRLVSEMVLHVLQKGQSKNSAFFFSSYAVMLVSTGRYSFGNRVDDFAVELSR